MTAYGYKLIADASVRHCATLEELAELLIEQRGRQNVRARICTSLTAQRPLTYEEQAELVELAAARTKGTT
jgi:hypothetical protein